MGRIVSIGAVGGLAILIGGLVASKVLAGALVAFALLGLATLAARPNEASPVYRRYWWVPFAWVVLFAISNVKFTARSPLAAASGSLSADNVVELIAYVIIGIVTFLALYGGRPTGRPLPLTQLCGWALLALLSAAWSVIPLFSFVRATQLFVPIALCALSVRIWRMDRRAGELMWRRTLRLMVDLIAVGAALGFVFNSQWPEGRFTWPGAPHPIVASGMAGFALIALLAAGPSLLNMSVVPYLLRLGMFAAALFFGQTRSALLGVALVTVVALWLGGRSRPARRYLAIPAFLGGAIFVVLLVGGSVAAYLQRGPFGAVSSLNGRIPIWEVAVHSIGTIGRWFLGFGFGASRVVLFTQLSHAGEAHNSWVEFVLELGLVGVFLAILWIGFLALRLFRWAAPYSRMRWLGAALLSYVLVLSGADNYLASPGFGITTIAFLYILAIVSEDTPSLEGRSSRSEPLLDRIRTSRRASSVA